MNHAPVEKEAEAWSDVSLASKVGALRAYRICWRWISCGEDSVLCDLTRRSRLVILVGYVAVDVQQHLHNAVSNASVFYVSRRKS